MRSPHEPQRTPLDKAAIKEWVACPLCDSARVPRAAWRRIPAAERAQLVGYREAASRGLCRPCWFRMKRADRLAEFSPEGRPEACEAPDCDRPPEARNLCNRHYKRYVKYQSLTLPTAEDRFWSHVEPSVDGCWIWTAALDVCGYGRTNALPELGGSAHRVAYLLTVGPIPDGLQLDHLCRVRNCVNPAHLEPVTPAENNARSLSVTAQHARKTHCKRGHLFDDANTYRPSDGARRCRACKQEKGRQR